MSWQYEGVIAAAYVGVWACGGYWSPWLSRFMSLGAVIGLSGAALLKGWV